MGVENNECVIATTWNNEAVNIIMKWVKGIHREHQKLFTVIPSYCNEKQTIVLGPDGSKKGWDKAVIGKYLRDELIIQIEKLNYDDGSNPFDFIEVGYGEYGMKVLRGNCINQFSDTEYYKEKHEKWTARNVLKRK